MTRRLVLAALLAVLLASWAHAPAADAGTYDVYACQNGTGPNHSWSAYAENAGNSIRDGSCAAGAGVWANIGAVAPTLAQTGFYFWTPASTRVTEYDMSVQADWGGDGWNSQIDEYPSGTAIHSVLCAGYPGFLPAILNCPGGNSGWQRHYRSGLWAGNLRATIYCLANPCQSGWVTGRWNDIRVRLYNETPPSLSSGTGMWAATGWVRGSQAIGFTASDDVGIRYVQIVRPNVAYHLNEARSCDYTYAVPCPGSTTASTTIDTTALPNGAQPFQLWAMDSANNWQSAGKTVNVDNAPPTTALSRGAGDYSRTVRWSVADAHSGVDSASLVASYSSDGGATWQAMTGAGWDGGAFSATLPAGVPDGRVRVRLSGRDNAKPGGNSFTSTPAPVVVDGTAPATRLDGAGNPAVAHPGAITVTLSATDAAAGMGAAGDDEPAARGGHVAYKLDGGAWNLVRGDEAQIAVAGDGAHTLSYYAVDAAGNRSDERSQTITIGTAASAFESPARFWHRTINARSTFTAASRFGAPCPAAATLTASRDATVVEADQDGTRGTSGVLEVAPQPSRRDSLVGFPLPAAPDCIVESAKLRLYAVSSNSGSTGRPMGATRASSSWDEPDVSWSIRAGSVGAAATATVPATAGWMEWDVREQVQALYRYGDNGLLLRDTGTVAPAGAPALSLCSRESTVPACAGAQPQLVVRFSE